MNLGRCEKPDVCSACAQSYETAKGDTPGVCPHCGAKARPEPAEVAAGWC